MDLHDIFIKWVTSLTRSAFHGVADLIFPIFPTFLKNCPHILIGKLWKTATFRSFNCDLELKQLECTIQNICYHSVHILQFYGLLQRTVTEINKNNFTSLKILTS